MADDTGFTYFKESQFWGVAKGHNSLQCDVVKGDRPTR